jgi:hypothetical protein
LDDLIQIVPNGLNLNTYRALKALSRRNFYGGTLNLLENNNPEIAFGLLFQLRHDCLLVRETFTFVESETREVGLSPLRSSLTPAYQFGVTQIRTNTVVGRLFRHLDTTSGDEKDVKNGLNRILGALRVAQYPVRILSKAVAKVERQSWANLASVKLFLCLPPSESLAWCNLYDLQCELIHQGKRSDHRLMGLRSRAARLNR